MSYRLFPQLFLPSYRWLIAFALLAALTASAQPAPRQVLHGHRSAAWAAFTPAGRLPATNRLQISIGLPWRNPNELAGLLANIYDPASPQYRHYLSSAEFTQRFGPSEADYNAVIAFARAHGLAVQHTYANRMLVDVEGSVADVEQALHVTLNTYAHPREQRKFFAPDTEPSLELTTPVLHISGLDNYVIPHPFLHERPLANHAANATPMSGSGPSGTFAGNDFRAAYLPGVTLTGTGQSVGLVEFGGYYGSDITNYENTYGLPHVPLVNVLLNGVNLTANTGPEEPLDIEMAIDMAPGLSQVVVYYGGNGDSVLNQIASDNSCKQIGASWGYGSDGDTTMIQDFQEFAAQGQSYFNASGDSDADVGSPFAPSDPPYVISVGGTTLTTSSPGGSWVSEKVWNWGGGTGGSGGVSTQFAIPPWQQGIDMTACQGSTTLRNIPDVALTADNIWVDYNNGGGGSFGGTSCATPLWAGLTALINQQAVSNNYPTVGFLNPAVYALGKSTNYGPAFHDIVTGNNTSPTSPSKYYAVAGYDLCTGWGTPNGQNLINALATPGPARAGAITWSPPATISTNLDVCTWGTSLYACDWNNVNQTVNGVSFTGSASTTTGGAYISLSGTSVANATSTFTSGSNPYNGLAAAYKNILAGGDYSGATTLIVTLANLLAGHTYAAQVWVNDARSTGNGRTETVYGNNGGNTVTLKYNSNNTSGGVGQYAIGVFTADGTNDSFTLLGNSSTQINALQVRDVTACPWNYWGGYVNGNWDNTTTNWGNGQPYSLTSVLYNTLNFADTNFYGATIANNVITLPATGESLGALNFVNNSVNYTLQNASGTTGITGTTAVNVSGTGTVTFTSANTYTGITTINNGTLALSGSGSVAGSAQLVLNGGTFDVSALGSFTASSSQPMTFAGGTLMASNLTLNGAAFTNTVINQSAPWLVASNFIFGATASTVTFPSLLGFAAYPVQFPLMQYTGGTSGTFNFNAPNLPAGYAGYLSNNVANSSVDLVLTAGGGPVAPLVWEGNVNGHWDILTTTNWAISTNLAAAQTYENSSPVLFNDTATGTTNVTLQTTLQPASVTVSNNALNYAFSGGQLAGPMTLTKSGSGQLTVSSANTYTGGTAITGGTLQLNAATAAGSGTIADGGTLNVNIGGNALNNAITGNGNLNVLETSGAATTLGGLLAGFTGTLNVPASSGTSKTAIISSTVNLNSTATINIASGGTLYVSGESILAPINIAGLGNSENYGALRLDNGATAAGTITLQGNTALGVYTGVGMVTGAIGDGGHGYSLLLEGSGPMILFNANTYSGGTILKSTTAAVRNTGAFGTGLLTITNSSTLDGNGITLTNPVTIASGQTLTLYSAVTLNGTLTGSGALASGGYSVTYTLGGNSPNFAGAINLGTSSGSTLSIPSGAGLTTSGALNNTSAATLTVNGGLAVNTASVSVNGTTTLNGSGTFTNGGFAVANNSALLTSLNQLDTGYYYLGNASSQYGSVTQTVATVNLSTTVADSIRIGHYPSESSSYLLNGGTLNATNSDPVVGWDGNGSVTISGGTANLNGLRLGDTAANGNHNGNGTVTITSGTLNLGADGLSAGGTGAHTVTLGGGKVGALATWSSSVPMSLTNPTGVIFDTTGGNISLSGILSGAGTLIKNGTNTLTLSATNSYTGNTAVNAGTLSETGSYLPAATNLTNIFTVNGGSLSFNLGSGSASYYGDGYAYSPQIGVGSYTGTLTLQSGTLNVNTMTNAGTGNYAGLLLGCNSATANGSLIVNGGNLNVPGRILMAANASGSQGKLTLNGGKVTLGTPGTTGSYSVVDGQGVVWFGGSTSTVNLYGGTLALWSLYDPTSGSAVTVNLSGGTLQAIYNNPTFTDVTAGSLTLKISTNGVTIDPASYAITIPNALTHDSGVSGADGGLTVNDSVGGGTLTLSAVNTYTGPTTISGGKLQLGGAGQLGSGSYAGNITNATGATLEDSSSANQTLSGSISGGGALTKDTSSSSTLTLTGAVSYNGATTVSAGKLVVPSTHSGTGAVTVGASAKLEVVIAGTSQWKPASLALANPSTLEFTNLQNSGTTTAPLVPVSAVGAVSGITINLDSISGIVTLPGKSYPLLGNEGGTTNGYALGTQPTGVTGHLAVSGNTLVYVVDSAPSDIWAGTDGTNPTYWNIGTSLNWTGNALNNSPANTYAQGDMVVFNDTASPASPVTVSIQAAVTPTSVTFSNSTKNYTVAASGANVIGGSTGLTKNGTGTVVLTGGTHTYTGATFINAGTLQLGNGSSGNDATLAGTSGLTNNAALVFNPFGGVNASYPISGSGTVTKQGAGTQTLTGTNTYLGPTTISGGTLTIGGSGTLGGGNYAGKLTNNAAFTYASASNQILSGIISGTGTLTELGSGTLTLAGTNTYLGSTTISNGTLALGASSVLPSSTTINLTAGTLAMGANNNTVTALQTNGVVRAKGTWGSASSTANHINTAITGTGILTVTTGGASTSVVTSSANTSTYGNAVTFTNTVTGSGGDGSAPNGNVTFYDGTNSLGTATLAGSSGTVSTYTLTLNNLTVGTHSLTASYAGNASYDVSISTALVQTVNQAVSTVTLAVGNTPATYNGLGQAATVILSGTNTLGNLTNILTGGQPTQTNVGTYAVTATFVPVDTNYTTLTGLAAGTFTIYPATLTITAANTNKVYGQTLTLSGFTTSGLTNSDTVTDVTLTSSGATVTATVGSYPLDVTNAIGSGLTNYAISYVAGTLSVTPLAVALTGTRAYDGTTNAAAASLSVTNAVNGDTVTMSGGAGGLAGAAVGTNAITSFGSLTLDNNSGTNYTLAGASGALIITNTLLTITANDDSKTYDGNPYATNNGATYTGFVYGETNTDLIGSPTYGGSAEGAITVGSYAITPAGYTSTNYLITYVSGTLTINQATPVINTLPTASILTVGQMLSAATLSGGTVTPTGGNFGFTASNTVPPLGTALYSITYTPLDTTDYTNATTNISVTVIGTNLTLTSVSPNPVTGSSFPETLSLNGSGFTGATAVWLTNLTTATGFSYVPVVNNDTNLAITNFAPGTAAAAWTATVFNGAPSTTVGFTVTAPVVVSINAGNLQSAGTGNLVLSGTGGVPGASYVVLGATNLNPPVVWTPVVTNTFNPDGSFSYTNPVVPGTPKLFLSIQQ